MANDNSNYVWYACYGSNILSERFLKYIKGGVPRGSTFVQHGCTDKTPPVGDEAFLIPHRLYFAQQFQGWESMGVGFVEHKKDETNKTLGRMYRITREQFTEVVQQENSAQFPDGGLEIDFEGTVREGFSEIKPEWYGRILFLGEADGDPVFTFTARWGDGKVQYSKPGIKYLTTIICGIKEVHRISDEEIAEYFMRVPGVKGNYVFDELVDVVKDAEVLRTS